MAERERRREEEKKTEGSRIVVWGGAEKKRRIISGTMNEAKKNRLAVGAIEEFKRRQECPGQSLEQPAYHAGQYTKCEGKNTREGNDIGSRNGAREIHREDGRAVSEFNSDAINKEMGGQSNCPETTKKEKKRPARVEQAGRESDLNEPLRVMLISH